MPDSHHVDIANAQAHFNELERVLSIRSLQGASEPTDRSSTERDPEKGEKREEGFDLRAYLTSSNDAHEKAGLAHKHVGVTWENLQVDGIGGAGHKVGLAPLCLRIFF